jgi:purine-binding chemotaxis protein CheW
MLALIARLGDTRLGFAAESVVAIHRAVLIAPLPGAPAPVSGVVHVRGEAIPVIDLAERLALPPRPVLSADEHLVVLAAGGRTVAVRVDEAEELREIDARDVARGEGLVASARTVAGVARLADGTLTIHDPAAFLTQAESDALAAALAPGAG